MFLSGNNFWKIKPSNQKAGAAIWELEEDLGWGKAVCTNRLSGPGDQQAKGVGPSRPERRARRSPCEGRSPGQAGTECQRSTWRTALAAAGWNGRPGEQHAKGNTPLRAKTDKGPGESRTAKGGSCNEARYSNQPRLRMQNCQGFELTWAQMEARIDSGTLKR